MYLVRHLWRMGKVVLKHVKLEETEEEISISLFPLVLQVLRYYKKCWVIIRKDLFCSP